MFAIHESSQRLICRVAFVLLCLAPTIYVAGWAAAVNSPQYESSRRAAWERYLSSELGLTTSIARVSQPARAVTLLHDVTFSGPESETPLLRVRVIELRPYEDGWMVSASQTEADVNRLREIWRILDDRLLVRGLERLTPVWIRCSELTLRGEQREQTLAGVSAKYHLTKQLAPETLIEFHLPDRRDAEPCRLALTRDRSLRPPATVARLDTNGAALPCSVLAGSFAFVDALGEKAEFKGLVHLQSSEQGYSGTITQSEFLNVDTQRLLAACSLHTLRTRANLQIKSAIFREGRLESVTGAAAAKLGVIDRHFLSALNREMQIAAPEGVIDSDQDKLSFVQMAFDFSLDEKNGLYVQGTCGGALQGSMLVGPQGPLLFQPQRPHMTAVSLIRALSPRNDVQAPATQQTRRLVNVLPVPDLTQGTAERPRASLHLRNSD